MGGADYEGTPDMATVTEPTGLDLRVYLEALAGQSSALVPTSELAGIWLMPEADALDFAAELESGGLIQTWDDGGEMFAILSSLAAERLGLELEPPDGPDLRRARWVPRGQARPPKRPKGKHAAALESELFPEGPGLRGVPDPNRGKDRVEPYPYHVLGISLQWPVAWSPDSSCPGCGCAPGRPMTHPFTVCTICHRGSYSPDPVVERVLGRAAPKAAGGGRGLNGGTGETKAGKLKVKATRKPVKHGRSTDE